MESNSKYITRDGAAPREKDTRREDDTDRTLPLEKLSQGLCNSAIRNWVAGRDLCLFEFQMPRTNASTQCILASNLVTCQSVSTAKNDFGRTECI